MLASKIAIHTHLDGASAGPCGADPDPSAGAAAPQDQPREPGLDRGLVGECVGSAFVSADRAGFHA